MESHEGPNGERIITKFALVSASPQIGPDIPFDPSKSIEYEMPCDEIRFIRGSLPLATLLGSAEVMARGALVKPGEETQKRV